MTEKFNPRTQKFIDQMVAYCGKKTATQCAIDRQILAATKMIRLPDGQMKLEQDMSEQDYENLMMNILKKHDALPSKNSRKRIKEPG